MVKDLDFVLLKVFWRSQGCSKSMREDLLAVEIQIDVFLYCTRVMSECGGVEERERERERERE